MSKRKRRKSQPVVMPEKDTGKLVIKASELRVSYGHVARPTGTGRHSDSRLRRRRTRGALRRHAIADSRSVE